MTEEKKIVIIAGPNGAGKTTFAREFLPFEAIRRRFASGMRNFLGIYRERVDYWQWIDNSGTVWKLIEEGANR